MEGFFSFQTPNKFENNNLWEMREKKPTTCLKHLVYTCPYVSQESHSQSHSQWGGSVYFILNKLRQTKGKGGKEEL